MTNENEEKKELNYEMFNKFQLLYLKIIAQNRLCVCRQQSRQCCIALKVYLHRQFHTDCECFSGLVWSLFTVRNSTTPIKREEKLLFEFKGK